MHRSVLVINPVVCTKLHGCRPNFEAGKRIINVGPEKDYKTTCAHTSRCYAIIFIAIYEYNYRLGRPATLKIILLYVQFPSN